jgi:hypothetical protein
MALEEGESGEDLSDVVEAVGEDSVAVDEAVVGKDLAALSEVVVAEAWTKWRSGRWTRRSGCAQHGPGGG